MGNGGMPVEFLPFQESRKFRLSILITSTTMNRHVQFPSLVEMKRENEVVKRQRFAICSSDAY